MLPPVVGVAATPPRARVPGPPHRAHHARPRGEQLPEGAAPQVGDVAGAEPPQRLKVEAADDGGHGVLHRVHPGRQGDGRVLGGLYMSGDDYYH